MKPLRARSVPPLRSLLRRESGATAVEFAMVLAVLIPIVFGLFEMGRALHMRNALDYLADRAARSLMVEYSHRVPAPGGDASALQATLLEDARNRVVGIQADGIMLSLVIDGDAIIVRLSYQAGLLIPFVPLHVREILLGSSRTLSLTAPEND
ncbi:MAG: pilus assembly protein [Pararhodobacter sp.]|nr:pilus assembly protein [Pararhodobacter sp.]